jgi:hypothetical protein
MTVFVMVSATLTYVVAKEVVDFFQQKFDDFRRSLRDTFGHSVRGEFEVNTGALRSNAGNYGQAGKELHRIAEEVSRIEKSLQYDSLSGGLTKAALWRISGCIDKDGKHAEKLEDALYKAGLGYEYKEVVEEITRTGEGDNAVEIKHRREVTRYSQPNVTALIFALKNLKKHKFKDRPVEEVERVDDLLMTLLRKWDNAAEQYTGESETN